MVEQNERRDDVGVPTVVLQTQVGKLGRIVGNPWFWVILVTSLMLAPILGALLRNAPKAPDRFGVLPDFELVDERGRPFGSKQLKGHVYVANFVFTACPAVCPRLMERMAQVQHRSRNAANAVHLVTISVDPENDTPEKMAAYGRRFRASPYRWSLLTGDYKVIEETTVKGFKLAMGKDADNMFEIFHSERFVLVDYAGNIRGYYEANDEGIDKLMRDIGLVLNLG